jgi:hypothetical protein
VIIRYFFIFYFSLAGTVFAASQDHGAKNPLNVSAESIYQQTIESYQHIQSYSYTNYEGEYDLFVKKKEENAKENYGTLAGKYGYDYQDYYKKDQNGMTPDSKNNDDLFTNSQFKKGVYQYKFLKPFIIQMSLVDTDYIPSILNNSVMVYRPDENPKVFRFYPRSSSYFSLSRSIFDESGGFLTMNWTTDIIKMKLLHERGKLQKNAGKESIDGRSCYTLEFSSFDREAGKEIIGRNLQSFHVPLAIYPQLHNTIVGVLEKNFSKVKYWIDAEKLVIVKVEEYINGQLYSSKVYKDIKINNLSLKDFNPIKPSKTFFE